ncbi:thermonuclease family protein [Shimia aestuarii]|uniref:thermonuclease family protein n=1 Tax=Shimia aestuarii TaxID=254406 RepID=UPI003261906F
MKPIVAIFMAAWLLSSSLTAAQELVGPVTHIRDGDTIEVSRVPIRLNGLNCDERGTRLGNQATAAMKKLVSGKRLNCRLNGEVTYDRRVGRCSLPDGQDIGALMIANGYCGRCDRYDPSGSYIAAQKKAGRYRGSFPSYCKPR